MADFLDAQTHAVLHSNVGESDNHMFHVGNKIEITDRDENQIMQYRITDIVIPYTFSRGIFGGLNDVGKHPKIFLELVSTKQTS
jgi:hypothetical protein